MTACGSVNFTSLSHKLQTPTCSQIKSNMLSSPSKESNEVQLWSPFFAATELLIFGKLKGCKLKDCKLKDYKVL